MFEFAWPFYLLALPLPWLLPRWLRPWPRAIERLRLPHPQCAQAVIPVARERGRVRLLPVLAWAAMCLAAARPQWFGDAGPPQRSGRDLMLVVDVSGSMQEADMRLAGRRVSRMTAVKAVLDDFLTRREGDRVGLIVFGDRAYEVTPLTFDLHAVRAQLRDVVVGLAGRETAIGDGLALAVKRLRTLRAAGEDKAVEQVVMLLTDGVNNAGNLAPAKAAQLAAQVGIRVHSIGFGGTGGGLLSPFDGAPIDEAGLRLLAEATGGRYFRARATEELAQIYTELDRIEPSRHAAPSARPRQELFAWPLALALALLALGELRNVWGESG